MWFFNAYSGLSLRFFQVALIVAGGNPRPPALNDSPDILILLRIFSIISVIILKKKTSSQVLSYISYRYVPPPPPPSGRVFAPFWSENGNTLCPFWSGIGNGFLRELQDCMNIFIVSIPNE